MHTSTASVKLEVVPPVDLRKAHACAGLLRGCIDWRFASAVQDYVEKHHLARGTYDPNTEPGGVKNIVESAERQFGIKPILISCRLHSMKKVVLVAHEDCGAYGGSKKFAGPEDELAFHKGQLAKARDVIETMLRDKQEGCYDENGEFVPKEYVFLWAHFSDDGTHILIDELSI